MKFHGEKTALLLGIAIGILHMVRAQNAHDDFTLTSKLTNSTAANRTTNVNGTVVLYVTDTVVLTFEIESIDRPGTFDITASAKYGDTHFKMDANNLTNVVGERATYSEELSVVITGVEIAIGEIEINATEQGKRDDPILIWKHTVHVNRVEPQLATIVRYLVIAAFFVTIFLIGITTEVHVVKKILIRPWGLLIGMVCQFVIMPFTAWSLAKLFQLDGPASLGLVLDGSCPGGSTSNVLSVLLDVDYVLSITMTFFSSIIALGMMPFNLFIYGRSFIAAGETIQTPFLEIFTQLLLLAVPLFLGMGLGYWKPKSKTFADKYIKPASGVILVCLIAADLPFNLFIFNSPWEYFVVALIFPLVGSTAGFIISKITRLTTRQSATVALETGVQNALLAVTVLYFFYPRPLSDLATRLPYLILIFTMFEGIALTIIYMLLKRFYWHGCPYDDEEDERPVVSGEAGPGETKVRDDEKKEVNGNIKTVSGIVGNGTRDGHCQVEFGDDTLAEINVGFEKGE